MEGALIGVFETDKATRDVYEKYFRRKGHFVVISALSSSEAFPLIQDYRGRLDVALVDLDPGDHRPEERENEEVVELLRTKFGETIKIVTVLSSGEVPEGANEHKEKMDLPGIVEYIDGL